MKSDHCSFKTLVSPYDVKKPVDWKEQFGRPAPLDVEIGFGMGENLMDMAQKSAERDFVGIEQHWERICKTLRAMTRKQAASPETFKNIRVLRFDARVCFERFFAPKSIDAVYCLFPCPWPKKGHIKYRLFSRDFLRLLNNRLKKNGRIKIVTDFYPFFEWISEQVKGTGFHLETATVQPRYNTKFERKWQDEGQEEFFELDLLKKRHIDVPVKKDIILKSYTLDNFNAGLLRLADVKGETTVIFKDVVFDQDRQKAMIHAIVAEEHLTQNLWISITKKDQSWRLSKAEGQNFFPTQGIAKAIELVYEAAKNTN